MCDVIQELVNEERVSAKAEGVAEGEAIGIRKEKTAMVKEMLKDGSLPVSRGCQEFCVNGILNHSFTLSPKTMENWLRASPQLRIG